MKDKFFQDLRERIKTYFSTSGGHSFDHTERVYNLAIKISKREENDLDIIKAAALLHDIARDKEDTGKVSCHAEEGAKIAEKILREMNFPENKIEKVIHAIKVHRYSKKLKAKTKEAEIIQDADRLDALGAIAIARIFSQDSKFNIPMYNPNIKPKKVYAGSGSSTSINHFYEKILKIKPETFKTTKAKEIAKERYAFIKEFVERFVKEWKGEL